jgi:hypothetical protein
MSTPETWRKSERYQHVYIYRRLVHQTSSFGLFQQAFGLKLRFSLSGCLRYLTIAKTIPFKSEFIYCLQIIVNMLQIVLSPALTRLITRKDFSTFIRSKSFKTNIFQIFLAVIIRKLSSSSSSSVRTDNLSRVSICVKLLSRIIPKILTVAMFLTADINISCIIC